MQIVIGAIGILAIAILGYLSWILTKEEYSACLGCDGEYPQRRVRHLRTGSK